MMWRDGSWAWWWMPGMLFMVLCMVMMMRMMSYGHGSDSSHTSGSHRQDGAERILAERLARGEIDIEEYERHRAALQQTREPDRT
jgi:putative membrane protein